MAGDAADSKERVGCELVNLDELDRDVGPALGALSFCVALGIKRKRAHRPARFTTAPQGFVVSTPTMAIEYDWAVE